MTEPNKPEGGPRREDDDIGQDTPRDETSGTEGPDAEQAPEQESGAPQDATAEASPDGAVPPGDPTPEDDTDTNDAAETETGTGTGSEGDAPGEDTIVAGAQDDTTPPPGAETADGMEASAGRLDADESGPKDGSPAAEAVPERDEDDPAGQQAATGPDAQTGTDRADPLDVAAAAAATGAASGTLAAGGTQDGAPPTGSAPREAPSAAPPPADPVVVEKRGGFLPGFLGGALAVAGAVFAAPYVLPQNMRPVMSLEPVETELAAQTAALAEQADRIEALSTDLSALSGAAAEAEAVDSLAQTTTERLDALRTDLDGVAAQIEELTRRPVDDSLDPQVTAALESYNAEVSRLTDTVEERLAAAESAMVAQTEENRRMIEEAAAATEAAMADAEAEAAEAEAEAEAARRRQALVEVRQALEAGAPFADALAPLDGSVVPAALADAAETGVPTLAALQESFAEPARAALDAARRAEIPDDTGGRVTSFLQTQLGVRSLAPRDGGSPDAVLSRAEASLRNAEIAAAIDELAALPEVAQQEMAGWVAEASARAEAVAAADELAATLATN